MWDSTRAGRNCYLPFRGNLRTLRPLEQKPVILGELEMEPMFDMICFLFSFSRILIMHGQQQQKKDISNRFSKRIPTWWQDGGGTSFAAPFSFAWQTGSCCLARGYPYRQPTGCAGTRVPHVLWKDRVVWEASCVMGNRIISTPGTVLNTPVNPWQKRTWQADIVAVGWTLKTPRRKLWSLPLGI